MADNQVVQGLYDGNWSSMHTFDLPYQVHNKLFQRYGKGQFAIDILRRMGNEFEFKGTPFYAHEEGKWYKTVTTFGASTGGATAGAEITFELSSADIDSNGDSFPRVGFSILYKHTDNKVYELRITNKTASSGSVSGSSFDTATITAKPYDSTLTVGVGGIADGTTLTIGASAFAEDTGLPAGTTKGVFRRAFYDRILKEKKTITGVQMGLERWTDKLIGGRKYLYSDAYAHEEFLLDAQQELACFLGQLNTNSLTQTGESGNSYSVKNAKGYWKWMDELAGKLTYGTGDFDVFVLDEVSDYLRTQGVITDSVWMGVGPQLMRKIENAGYDFVQQFSGGTDFTKMVSKSFKGDADRMLGTQFKIIYKDGIYFYITVLDSFGNVEMLGNADLDFNNSGFIVPMGNKVKDPKTGKTFDNIGTGYNIYGDVNRKRVIRPLDGINGRNGANTVTQYDNVNIGMLSHVMPFMISVNQCMQVLPYESY